jgi:hypothetical protein
MALGIGGVIAADALLIRVHSRQVLWPIRIMPQRRHGLHQPTTPSMNTQ